MGIKDIFLEESLIGFYGNLEFMLRLILAAISGGIIGYERTRRRKEAGIRTHVIVAIGAALMMVISKYGFYDVLEATRATADATRIAANVITGISFLGAGVIFVKRVTVKGLTTAAGLWATAGIGLAIGAGMYFVGIFTTIFITIIQVLLHSNINKRDNLEEDTVAITFYQPPEDLSTIKAEMNKRNIQILHFDLEKNDDGTTTVLFDISRETVVTCADLTGYLSADPRVKSFKL